MEKLEEALKIYSPGHSSALVGMGGSFWLPMDISQEDLPFTKSSSTSSEVASSEDALFSLIHGTLLLLDKPSSLMPQIQAGVISLMTASRVLAGGASRARLFILYGEVPDASVIHRPTTSSGLLTSLFPHVQ